MEHCRQEVDRGEVEGTPAVRYADWVWDQALTLKQCPGVEAQVGWQRTGTGQCVGDGHRDEDDVGLGAHVTSQQDGTDKGVGDDCQNNDERRDDTVDNKFEARQPDEV